MHDLLMANYKKNQINYSIVNTFININTYYIKCQNMFLPTKYQKQGK